MTQARKRAPRLAAISAAALAALLLAGCSTGHIGETWQCPLAEGGLCDSVATADPAVPDRKAVGTAVLAEPLWRVRGDELPEPPPEMDCATACGAAIDPFAWLARLFDDGGNEGPPEPAMADTAPEPPASPPASAGAETGAADPATALLPAPGSRPGQAPGPARDEPDASDLRTVEVVARIWVAPFVDADGVYREASYIRVVLEPAGWRLR